MAGTSAQPEGETPTQRQARLRREKRLQKMAEQGVDRLAKIKALNGGVAPSDELLGGPAVAPANATGPPKSATVHDDDDPEEADIDTVSGANTPNNRNRDGAGAGGMGGQNDMFASLLQQRGGQGGAPRADGEEDPMVRMMQQITSMMGGNPQDPNDPNQVPQIPPMLQAMMGGTGGIMGDGTKQKAPITGAAYVWRIVHAVFACSLAVYVLMTTAFTGAKHGRQQAVYAEGMVAERAPQVFTLFITAELLLQGSRFFLEKGQLQGSGWIAMVANSGFVPEPYAQWVRTGGRWLSIAQSIISDAMVVVFVVGAVAWWRGAAIA